MLCPGSTEDATAQHVSKKRRAAESSDGVSEGGAGDVARARPTWEDMVIAYSTIPGQCAGVSIHVNNLIARLREPPGPRQGHLVHPVAGGGVHGARPRHGAGGPPAHDQVTADGHHFGWDVELTTKFRQKLLRKKINNLFYLRNVLKIILFLDDVFEYIISLFLFTVYCVSVHSAGC